MSTFALFEIGACHQLAGPRDNQGLPLDEPRLALVYCHPSTPSAAFYGARRYLDLVAKKLGYIFTYKRQTAPKLEVMAAPYDKQHLAEVFVGDRPVGVIGLLDSKTAGFELDVTGFLEPEGLDDNQRLPVYQPLSKYPTSHQDLTLQVDKTVPYDDLWQTLTRALATHQAKGWRCQLQLVSVFYPDQGSVQNLSWRLRVASLDKTLQTAEVSAVVADLVAAVSKSCQARQV